MIWNKCYKMQKNIFKLYLEKQNRQKTHDTKAIDKHITDSLPEKHLSNCPKCRAYINYLASFDTDIEEAINQNISPSDNFEVKLENKLTEYKKSENRLPIIFKFIKNLTLFIFMLLSSVWNKFMYISSSPVYASIGIFVFLGSLTLLIIPKLQNNFFKAKEINIEYEIKQQASPETVSEQNTGNKKRQEPLENDKINDTAKISPKINKSIVNPQKPELKQSAAQSQKQNLKPETLKTAEIAPNKNVQKTLQTDDLFSKEEAPGDNQFSELYDEYSDNKAGQIETQKTTDYAAEKKPSSNTDSEKKLAEKVTTNNFNKRKKLNESTTLEMAGASNKKDFSINNTIISHDPVINKILNLINKRLESEKGESEWINDSLFIMAANSFNTKNYSKSKLIFQQLEKKQPESIVIQNYLLLVNILLDKNEQAQIHLNNSLKLDPTQEPELETIIK